MYFIRLEVPYMIPFNPGGHATYQHFLRADLRKHYPDYSSIPLETWNIIERFYAMDLSKTDKLMMKRYSKFGPEPRLPSLMLRSYLLSIELKFTSVPKWVSAMKTCPLYAILSGFEFGDTPGVGTFYDFFDRLWLYHESNFSPHLKKPKEKVKKPVKGKDKADPVEKVTVDDLIASFSLEPYSPEQPFSLLFELFKKQFLDISNDMKLIDLNHLSLAGDGMPVYTSNRERKKRVCKCKDERINNCDCERSYSQPDCDIGWDSSRKCFYSGYDAYFLVEASSYNDLPIFPLLNTASRHDSHGFVHTLFAMKSFMPEATIDKLILDSAHDAMPIYEYCRDNNISPFIDLNDKRGIKLKYKGDFTILNDGVPRCPAGYKMRRDGKEIKKKRLKYRCPKINRKNGLSCDNPCSSAKCGRTVHLPTKDNPRLINIPPRDSKEWKEEYKRRTSAERSNKRQKIDFQLENGKHQSSKMWYCRLYGISMLQHLNAWGAPHQSLKSLLEQAA
jgi:hypothetical protein